MLSIEPRFGESKPGLAVGGGILVGAVTLTLVAAVVTFLRPASTATGGPQPGDAVTASALNQGDCMEPGTTTAAGIVLRDCAEPHGAQVTGRIPFTNPGDSYPGADRLSLFVGHQCEREADRFLAAPLLATNLASYHLVPSLDDWIAGDTSITCYVSRLDGSDLASSVQDQGAAHPRSSRIPVSRLMVGDCFAPAEGVASYELNSNSRVDVVPCAGEYNGTFFGRRLIDSPAPGAAFPGDAEMGRSTSELCAGLFLDTFGVPADGFNYRYWRPNQQSWDLGDRSILCAVLDAEPLSGPFQPDRYQPFFDLPVGECFQLGPEETDRSLGLDDQVLIVDCQQGHAGQMIGSGALELEDPLLYPGEKEVEQLAGAQCEQLFESFVGVSPFESELVNFPFWYPNEAGWEQGDRRYACAFLDPTDLVGSLEDSGR